MPPHAEDDFFAPAAEKALSFISRQLKDARLSADRDMKEVGRFPRSIRPFSGKNEDWESNWFKGLPIGGSNKDSAEKFFRQVKDSSLALSKPGALDDLEPFKSLKEIGKEIVPAQFPQFRPPTLQPGFPHAGPVIRSHGGSGGSASDAEKMRHQGQKFGEEWQLLRRMRDSLKELDQQVATSKTEFFENVAKNLKLNNPAGSGKAGVRQKVYINDVAPLDVPELLEHLVRQSEPFLDQLGVTKEASAKMRAMIRNCSKKVDSLGLTLSAALSERVQSERAQSGGSAGSSGREEQDVDMRLARVMESTGYKYGPAWHRGRGTGAGRRKIAVVTTASLPWMTGTSINPLLRAAYLAKDTGSEVTLVVPWLSLPDQEELYPNKMRFESPAEQEEYVRGWLRGRIGFEADFKIAFYPGRYHKEKRSILAVGDITSFIPGDGKGDLAVLEEPEHLTWYHHGARWQDKFQQVVGIVHTNYLEYARREKDGDFYAFLLEHVNSYMVKTYCHKVVRLSAATQEMPKSVVCNVHGVSSKFLDIGARVAAAKDTGKPPFTKGAYFLGKMIWTKGYRELLDLMDEHKQSLEGLRVDVFGSGDDSKEVHAAAVARNLPMRFHRGRDHADSAIQSYKVFINPSMSDVVCTTTAEALAMGKIVVCADHPSNAFFRDFPNCYTYKTPAEFIEKVKQAMAAEPQPLTDEERHKLSWEAATERFLEIAESTGLSAKTMPSDGAATASETPLPTPRHSLGRAKKQNNKLKYSASMPNLQRQQPDASTQDQQRAETPPHTRAMLPPQTLLGGVTPLSLSLSGPDMDEVVERAMHGVHYLVGCLEPVRLAGGAVPGSGKVSFEQCKEMGIDPPMVRDPVYTW